MLEQEKGDTTIDSLFDVCSRHGMRVAAPFRCTAKCNGSVWPVPAYTAVFALSATTAWAEPAGADDAGSWRNLVHGR